MYRCYFKHFCRIFCYVCKRFKHCNIMERKEIESLSLKGLKVFFKTCMAKSPEMEMIKSDLKIVIKAIESRDTLKILECNKYITKKYPMIYSEAFKYNLRYMKEDEFMKLGIDDQIMSLHQLAHFLEDSLKKETIKTKLVTAVSEILEGMLFMDLNERPI